MNAQRRSGIWTHWNISHEKKKKNDIGSTTDEPRDNHTT